jgi:TRAP-type C4-dicarboxylate transport system substrate-binding protein
VLVTAVATVATIGWVAGASATDEADTYPDVTLRLADVFPSTDAWTLWAQQLATKVAKDTNGHLKIVVYPNGTLGTNSGAVTAASQGAVDMTAAAPQLESPLAPGIEVQFLPGFIHTPTDAAKLIRSPAVLSIKDNALAKANLKLISQCFTGFIYTVSKNPLPTASAMKGVKFRVPDQGNADMVAALGGNPSIIPLSETFTALQLGTVEATPATLATAVAQKYWQVAKYVNLTPLAANFEDLLINTNSFAKLSPAERRVLMNDGVALQDECSSQLSKATTDALDTMRSSGATIVPAASDYTPYSTAFASLLAKGENENALSAALTKAETKALAAKPVQLAASVAGAKALLTGTKGLTAGPVVVTVKDTSKTDGFVLTGPGVSLKTGVGATGKTTWKVTLQPGKYVYGSARSAKGRHTFVVKI